MQKLVGTLNNTIYDNVTNFYNNANNIISLVGKSRTTDQIQKTLADNGAVDGEQTYTGWDFDTIWDAGSACEYPRLRWQNEPLQVSCVLHGGSTNST